MTNLITEHVLAIIAVIIAPLRASAWNFPPIHKFQVPLELLARLRLHSEDTGADPADKVRICADYFGIFQVTPILVMCRPLL